jgi:hypothetical protein
LAHVKAFNLQGGQYKLMGEKTVGNLSKMLYNETNHELFDNLQSHQKYPVEWLTWPYPTGKSEMKNYYLEDYGNFLPPYIPGGEK